MKIDYFKVGIVCTHSAGSFWNREHLTRRSDLSRLLCTREVTTVLYGLIQNNGKLFMDGQARLWLSEFCLSVLQMSKEKNPEKMKQKFTLINMKLLILLLEFGKLSCTSLFDKFNFSRNTYSTPNVFSSSCFIQSIRYITERNEI